MSICYYSVFFLFPSVFFAIISLFYCYAGILNTYSAPYTSWGGEQPINKKKQKPDFTTVVLWCIEKNVDTYYWGIRVTF